MAAVKELATMVMPYMSLGGQAVEAQTRAAAIMEETEALKRQMEEHHITNSLAAAAAVAAAQMPASMPQMAPTPAQPQQGIATTFVITLRKADDVSLGLSVNADEKEEKALVVEGVLPGGAVESWNFQCFGGSQQERVVVPGDRIVCVNSIEGDVTKMLEECTKSRLVKLVIARAVAAVPPARASVSKVCSSPAPKGEQAYDTPEKTSNLRKKAPEFVPLGADAPPLQQTQHLAAPPGLFFRPEGKESTDKPGTHTDDLVAGVLWHGYGEAQEAGGDDDGSNKEN